MRYFAYGSNMNAARMLARVPGARKVGVARLDGWRLRERLYADIEPDAVWWVDGVVWDLPLGGISELDRYEGFPTVYDRRMLQVAFRNGRRTSAVAYVMTPWTRFGRRFLRYPEDYRRICSDGARQNGIFDAFKAGGEA